jgi:hypothetical protein
MTETTSARKNIDWLGVRGLGRVPDSVIAAREGCSRSAVRQARERYGVASAEPCMAVGVVWDDVVDLFIEKPSVIARRFGVSMRAVRNAKNARRPK